MKKTLELWSQWAFRICAGSLVGLLVLLTIRDQSHPTKGEVEDAKYLEKIESFVKVQRAHKVEPRPQMADDQRGSRATRRGISEQAPESARARG
jgi:hypothetical protein